FHDEPGQVRPHAVVEVRERYAFAIHELHPERDEDGECCREYANADQEARIVPGKQQPGRKHEHGKGDYFRYGYSRSHISLQRGRTTATGVVTVIQGLESVAIRKVSSVRNDYRG